MSILSTPEQNQATWPRSGPNGPCDRSGVVGGFVRLLGDEAIIAAVSAAAAQPPAAVLAAIESVVSAHRRGAEVNDDMTIVVGGM